MELREKVGVVSGGSAAVEGLPAAAVSDGDEDAVVALMSLGFTRAESVKAVAAAKAAGASGVEQIIMSALKNM